MSNKAPILQVSGRLWLQAFRAITRATDERSMFVDNVPEVGLGNSAPSLTYDSARAIASALVLANMNSLPLDWAARFCVGGINMNFFLVKQLPVLRPEAYLERRLPGLTYVELVVPRVLELTYTADDLGAFARDLGYSGPPFRWDPERRFLLRCELDAAFFHLYGIERDDVDYIMDAFPIVRRKDEQRHGEYRTKRVVLEIYDGMARAMKGGEPYRTRLDPPPADPRMAHPQPGVRT